MANDHRITLTRRHAYRTRSNKVKTIRAPGGRHVAQYISKSRKGAVCGDCHIVLPGIKHMDTRGFKNAINREKTVSRAYGGSRCHKCVRERIVRAFLVDEQKIVKRLLVEKSKTTKTKKE
jgi:large subunit ribosomal protein L34e